VARAIWKGAISFGLVNIPIELHTAVRDTRPHFRMLHAKDRSPVRFERVCIRDGHPVAWEDLVKGFEYSKGPLRRPHERGFSRGCGRENTHHRHHRFRAVGGN
jgi:non-homologous end joining protein Ku